MKHKRILSTLIAGTMVSITATAAYAMDSSTTAENVSDENTPLIISADSEIGRNIRIVDLSTITDDENMPMVSRNMVTENISDEDTPMVISADSVQIVDLSTIADDENMPMVSRNMVTENISDEDMPIEKLSLNASKSFNWSISADSLTIDSHVFSKGEEAEVIFTYSPSSASIRYGFIDTSLSNFYGVSASDGSVDDVISMNLSGQYYFCIYNTSSSTVTAKGTLGY